MSQGKQVNAYEIRRIKLPSIKSMFEFKRNPLKDDQRIKQLSEQLFEFSLMPQNYYERYANNSAVVAYFHPLCEDIDRYLILVRLWICFFIIDDHTECQWGDVARNKLKAYEIWGQFIDCLDRVMNKYDKNAKFISMANWKPYIIAMMMVFDEMSNNLNEIQMKRIAETCKDLARGVMEETRLIEGGHQIQSFDEYLSIRLKSAGPYIVFPTAEFSDNIYITDEEYYDPLMQKYFKLVSIILILFNDIYSLEKELNDNLNKPNGLFNYVALKMVLDNLKAEEALSFVVDILNDNQNEAMDIKQKLILKYETNENVKKFVNSIGYCTGGLFESSSLITRYNNFLSTI